MFGDGPLGREICGDEARHPAAARRGTIRDFWRTTYRPANTVVAVAGDLGHDEAVGLAAARSAPATGSCRVRAGAGRCRPARGPARQARHEQAQLCLGVPALHRDHPDSWTLAVLNAVLGDGMSSRLFLSVREELGLAYDQSRRAETSYDAGAG